MRTSTFVTALVFSAMALLAAPLAAQITGFEIRRVDNSDSLDEFVTNDLLVDFVGQYTGSLLNVELVQGSIFQNTEELHPAIGGDGRFPPDLAVIALFPAAQFDTFVAHGGPTSEDTFGGEMGLALGTGSTCKAFSCPPQFDEQGIDIAYFSAPGIAPQDMRDFQVARITLSSDALGTLTYQGAANREISERFERRIVNG